MIARVGPGLLRAIHDDDYPVSGIPPARASCVEPIPDGPCAGRWFVDMSPLGPDFTYCLWPPFERRDAALAAEHDHLVARWIRADLPKGPAQ